MAFLYVIYIAMVVGFAAAASTTLVLMLDAWRTPPSLERTRFSATRRSPRLSFSLIVPARHEERVLPTTLSRLAAIDHPRFEIVVVVGHDDDRTKKAAEEAAARHPGRIRVVVDTSWPKSKPKALNTALPACRGEIVGIFDAEDDVHPSLLRRIDECFQETRAHIVQAGIQLMNYRSSWYSVRNVLEYYFWFSSRLHFQARHRFIPLGGNTVFVRTPLLRTAGGWDPDCLAEDCELGARLSILGARTVVVYDPALVTREETPHSVRALARQRTRWNQGYLQVLRKGHWRQLRRRQRLLAVYTLAMPFIQAATGVLIPLSFVTIVMLDAPILLTLLGFVPLIPTFTILAVECAALGEFCRFHGFRARAVDYARLLFGMVPYQAMLTVAAFRALWRELRGVRNWEKTPHLGAHFAPSAAGVAGVDEDVTANGGRSARGDQHALEHASG